jgi:hypothetical protein
MYFITCPYLGSWIAYVIPSPANTANSSCDKRAGLQSAWGGFEPVMAKLLDRYGDILRDGHLLEKMLGG